MLQKSFTYIIDLTGKKVYAILRRLLLYGGVFYFCCTVSTLLNFSVRQHVDFKSTLSKSDYEEPVCRYQIHTHVIVDDLPGVEQRDTLQYFPETGLREVMRGDHAPQITKLYCSKILIRVI